MLAYMTEHLMLNYLKLSQTNITESKRYVLRNINFKYLYDIHYITTGVKMLKYEKNATQGMVRIPQRVLETWGTTKIAITSTESCALIFPRDIDIKELKKGMDVLNLMVEQDLEKEQDEDGVEKRGI